MSITNILNILNNTNTNVNEFFTYSNTKVKEEKYIVYKEKETTYNMLTYMTWYHIKHTTKPNINMYLTVWNTKEFPNMVKHMYAGLITTSQRKKPIPLTRTNDIQEYVNQILNIIVG